MIVIDWFTFADGTPPFAGVPALAVDVTPVRDVGPTSIESDVPPSVVTDTRLPGLPGMLTFRLVPLL